MKINSVTWVSWRGILLVRAVKFSSGVIAKTRATVFLLGLCLSLLPWTAFVDLANAKPINCYVQNDPSDKFDICGKCRKLKDCSHGIVTKLYHLSNAPKGFADKELWLSKQVEESKIKIKNHCSGVKKIEFVETCPAPTHLNFQKKVSGILVGCWKLAENSYLLNGKLKTIDAVTVPEIVGIQKDKISKESLNFFQSSLITDEYGSVPDFNVEGLFKCGSKIIVKGETCWNCDDEASGVYTQTGFVFEDGKWKSW